jgi:hypothetical protein
MSHANPVSAFQKIDTAKVTATANWSKPRSILAIPGPATESSPRRNLDAFRLSRYLEYCIEILAILSKISDLYAQSLHDEEVLDAVDDFEELTGGLSTRITSKLQQISS